MSATASTQTPPARVRVGIPAGRDAPAHAREALAALRPAIGERCLQTLELVVSELVTNSVRHSGARTGEAIELDVRCGDGGVRIAVGDGGAGFEPGQKRPEAGSLGGWGLYLVAEVVDRWWVESGPPTRVFAELATGEPGDQT